MSLEWGLAGALAAPDDATAYVMVDILSFTTAVTVAVSRGTEVVPCPDDDAARRLAVEAPGTALAVRRSSVDLAHPWSLSPADLNKAPAPERLALASPNGAAAAAALAADGKLVVACSLRNVTAVSNWLLGDAVGGVSNSLREGGLGRGRDAREEESKLPQPAADEGRPPWSPRRIVVVAAGERWPDGELRPALEDWIGAGLLLRLMRDGPFPVRLSPEAALAARSVSGLSRVETAAFVRESRSAAELRIAGYEEDVAIAVGVDADSVVPLLRPRCPGTAAAGFRPAPAAAATTTSGF